MADDKKTVVVYTDWIEKFEELEDDEAGRLIKHFFRYVNDLNPEAPDRITKLSFISIKQALKRDLDKWEKTLEGRSKAGKASAEKRRLAKLAQQESTNPTNVESVEKNPTNPTDSVNDNVNVSVKDINNIKERKEDFKKSILEFLDKYSRDMLKDFFGYWTEHNDKGKKMRYEYAKNQPFNISRRLATWNKKANEQKNKGKI